MSPAVSGAGGDASSPARSLGRNGSGVGGRGRGGGGGNTHPLKVLFLLQGSVDGGESLRCLLRESTLEEKKEFVGRNSFSERRGGGNGPPRSLLGRK